MIHTFQSKSHNVKVVKYNDEDKHGVGNDMRKDQLNDLVEYLKSLRDAKYYEDDSEIYKASVSNREKNKNHELTH